MRIGLQVSESDWPIRPDSIAQKLAEIARTADQKGFYSLWLPDHLLNASSVFGQPIDAPKLEGYTTISYLSALTQKIKIGLLVTCNLFRHPSVLVKTVSTLDVLSGGRAYLGIGAGWFEREAKGLGIPFPPLHERLDRLEETLRIAKHMWGGDRKPFDGKYYHLSEPINSPQPLSQPHPPILIGGGGEKRTLRLVAKYGDACNFFIGASLKSLPASYRETFEDRSNILHRKLAILKKHCDSVGRSYDDIEKTVQTYVRLAPHTQDANEVLQLCRELADLGIQHVILNIPDVHDIKPLEIIGRDVIPAVADLRAR